MTPKTKVLKILDKYRDKSLTIGCEVKFDHFASEHEDGEGDWESIKATVVGDGFYGELEVVTTNLINDDWRNIQLEIKREEVEILGHPATPLTLLKALGNMKGALTVDAKVDNNGWEQAYFSVVLETDKDTCQSYGFFVPFVTTLSEIPEEHEMWQAVLDVLI